MNQEVAEKGSQSLAKEIPVLFQFVFGVNSMLEQKEALCFVLMESKIL